MNAATMWLSGNSSEVRETEHNDADGMSMALTGLLGKICMGTAILQNQLRRARVSNGHGHS